MIYLSLSECFQLKGIHIFIKSKSYNTMTQQELGKLQVIQLFVIGATQYNACIHPALMDLWCKWQPARWKLEHVMNKIEFYEVKQYITRKKNQA